MLRAMDGSLFPSDAQTPSIRSDPGSDHVEAEPLIERVRVMLSRPLAIAALAAFAAHLAAVLAIGPGPRGSLASNVIQVLSSGLAAGLSVGAARRSHGIARRFWTLVAIAFAIWSAAQATYVYHENWIGERVPQPSWTHFLFRFYGAPLLMALLIVREDERSEGIDWRRVLDAAQVGILSLLFYFDLYFVPGGQWQGLTLLYLWNFFDLSDFENWSLFIAFSVRSRFSQRSDERAVARWLSPYLLAYALSSSFYNYTFSIRVLKTGDWADLVFTASLTIGALLAASWKEDPVADLGQLHRPAVGWAPAILPLVTAGLALPLTRSEPMVAFVAMFSSMACFGARLLLTLYRQRRLVEELQTTQSRYADLLRFAPDAIFVHTGGRIRFANPATATLLGLSTAEELVGRHVLEFAPPELREGYKATLGGRSTGVIRLIVIGADGRRRSLEAVGMNIESSPDQGELPTRLVIARDVTERERAESERDALIHALEAKNAELERFTYTVSHDLRSPLITIGSYISHVESAAEKGDLAALRDDVERIRRASSKMDRLLKDLLELSRIGHVRSPHESFSFEEAVRDAAALVQGRLDARGVEIDIAPGLPTVTADRVRVT